MSKIRIAIVDDHPVVRDGLFTTITYRTTDIEIVETAGTGAEAIRIAKEHQPDVLVLDIKLPDMTGLDVARQVLRDNASTRILMLTSYDDPDYIEEALQLGARGFLLKDAPPDEILRAIRTVAQGNLVFSGQLAGHIDRRGNTSDEQEEYEAVAARLTPREREILGLIAQGYDNGEIGDRLGVTEKTVRNYVSRIYDVLDIHARPRVIRWALHNRHFTDI